MECDWETSNIDKGTYIIRAYATPVKGETDTTDNTFIDGIVLIDAITAGGGSCVYVYLLLK